MSGGALLLLIAGMFIPAISFIAAILFLMVGEFSLAFFFFIWWLLWAE